MNKQYDEVFYIMLFTREMILLGECELLLYSTCDVNFTMMTWVVKSCFIFTK